MTTRVNMPNKRAVRTTQRLDVLIRDQLEPILDMLTKNPSRLRDDAFIRQSFRMVEELCGGDEIAKIIIMRLFITSLQQRNKLIEVLKALRERKPSLAWILSREFTVSRHGRRQRYIFAVPLGLGQTGHASECYQVVEEIPDDNDQGEVKTAVKMPEPPFIGVIEPDAKLFLGPVFDMPEPPLRAEIYDVVCSYPDAKFENLAELEVSNGTQERNFTVFTRFGLAEEIKKKMDEDGESVCVRVESGVATDIHGTDDRKHQDDWLEFPPLDGPSVNDLILPAWLRREWDGDIRNIARSRGVRVLLVGPTGMGKTTACERVGRDAVEAARRLGRSVKGFALIRISSSHIGSSFIHQTERNLFRALKRAKALANKGFIVVVLLDEADALIGEMAIGTEHSHNRSERLMAQSLLTDPIDNVAVYCTMNARLNSFLSSAIDRRFAKRVYGRATRSQMEAVAAYYARQHSKALEKLRMSAAELAGVLVDSLYSDRRVVAMVHFYSGRTPMPVFARDMHNCSPGKTKDLVYRFCCDVIDGACNSIDYLQAMLDQEFHAPSLNKMNLSELTFIKLPPDDTVRHVELLR